MAARATVWGHDRLDADFTVDGPPELLAHLARLATRYSAATATLTGHGE